MASEGGGGAASRLQQDLLPGEQAWMVFALRQNAAASRTAHRLIAAVAS